MQQFTNAFFSAFSASCMRGSAESGKYRLCGVKLSIRTQVPTNEDWESDAVCGKFDLFSRAALINV
jgi:hypothetical protein